MEKIIIYGAGTIGKIAYDYLSLFYDCTFFVDKDASKWGGYTVEGQYTHRIF